MGAFIDHGPSADTSRHEADDTLRTLGRLRAASDFELCQWFLCGFRLRVHDLYGFASFREYAEPSALSRNDPGVLAKSDPPPRLI